MAGIAEKMVAGSKKIRSETSKMAGAGDKRLDDVNHTFSLTKNILSVANNVFVVMNKMFVSANKMVVVTNKMVDVTN